MSPGLIKRLFTVPGDDPELALAQHAAFTKQLPLLYFILATNSLAVAVSFHGVAPDWLTIGVTAPLCAACFWRLGWWTVERKRKPDVETALAHLRASGALAAGLTIAFTAWALALYSYGDPYARGLVVFFLASTMIGCIFCLMHVRSAVLSVAVLANAPFLAYFLVDPQIAVRSIAVDFALVSAALVYVTGVYYRDFANLIESRRATQRLSDENLRLANHDSLTGLANRRCFFESLSGVFAAAARRDARFAVGVIDLDGFKGVNDTYGHIVGDRLLAETSRRLEAACKGEARLFRLGGDEFAIIVEDCANAKLSALGKTIEDAVRQPFTRGEIDVMIGCTIGFAAYPDNGDAPMRLYEKADYALYFAKKQRRGQTLLFGDELETRIQTDGQIELALQNADLEQEMTMAFQPIVDARTGEASAFEALARWTSPVLGVVSPAYFIPVAERIGLVRTMTRILLRKSLAAAKDWPAHVRLAFNLSVHDIAVGEGVLHIVNIIQQSGVDPRRIEFEITETAVTHDFEQAAETVRALKALGARVALDDFGTGYSSLAHMRRLDLDKIKIDRSFVTDIDRNRVNFLIVKSLQKLCDDMELGCVCEGVETQAEMRTLLDIGCTVQQGYLYSRPISQEEALAFIGADPEARRAAG